MCRLWYIKPHILQMTRTTTCGVTLLFMEETCIFVKWNASLWLEVELGFKTYLFSIFWRFQWVEIISYVHVHYFFQTSDTWNLNNCYTSIEILWLSLRTFLKSAVNLQQTNEVKVSEKNNTKAQTNTLLLYSIIHIIYQMFFPYLYKNKRFIINP